MTDQEQLEALRDRLTALVAHWTLKADEKGAHGGFYKHSERTIATLRECSSQLAAVLAQASPDK